MPTLVSQHLRYRWLPNELLAWLPAQVETFLELLTREAEFERLWIDRLQPQTLDAGLFLPEPSFRAKAHATVWADVARVGPSHDPPEPAATLDPVTVLTRRFEVDHRVGDCFEDDREIQFRRGPKHGLRVEERFRWKFSWRIEAGFHYDACHARGSECSMRDWEGRSHSMRRDGHLNVDTHGRFR